MSKKGAFLGKRMTELREKNGVKSLQAMVDLLNDSGREEYRVDNKSTLSRAENGNGSDKTTEKWAEAYCDVLGLSELQKKQFFRGKRIAIPDTSALMARPLLINELSEEYSMVIIPSPVLGELNGLKDYGKSNNERRRAWEIIRSIGVRGNISIVEYRGDDREEGDDKIIFVARAVFAEHGCEVQIITNDADFAAKLKGDENVTSLYLREYTATKQDLVDMATLVKLDAYYADTYDNIEAPPKEEINAFLSNGYTLIISAVLDRAHSFVQRAKKIEWLIAHGADVDKCDCARYNFPPLTHAVQKRLWDMFEFLLKKCHANPNVGSRDPYSYGKLKQKNEGNMPLMVAAWQGMDEYVRVLCEDERTSINQQDSNGFTALIKACCRGYTKCRDILRQYGADEKIVDFDGKTATEREEEFLESGDQFAHRRKPKARKRQ